MRARSPTSRACAAPRPALPSMRRRSSPWQPCGGACGRPLGVWQGCGCGYGSHMAGMARPRTGVAPRMADVAPCVVWVPVPCHCLPACCHSPLAWLWRGSGVAVVALVAAIARAGRGRLTAGRSPWSRGAASPPSRQIARCALMAIPPPARPAGRGIALAGQPDRPRPGRASRATAGAASRGRCITTRGEAGQPRQRLTGRAGRGSRLSGCRDQAGLYEQGSRSASPGALPQKGAGRRRASRAQD